MRMKANIGLSDQQRGAVVKILNTLLADEFVLYTKTRRFHWNVVGPDFSELHKFFEGQYEALDDIVDEVAERARALDGLAGGSLAEFAQWTRLQENPGENPNEKGMLAELLADHETIIRALREDAVTVNDQHGDIGTNDFLTGLLEQH